MSAPIQPGNSGGPVFDQKGNVVGITVAKLRNQASSDSDVENVNYAIKMSYLAPLFDDLGIETIERLDDVENVCSLQCEGVLYIQTK